MQKIEKAKIIGAVRERERELYFKEKKYGFVQQSDTHTRLLQNK